MDILPLPASLLADRSTEKLQTTYFDTITNVQAAGDWPFLVGLGQRSNDETQTNFTGANQFEKPNSFLLASVGLIAGSGITAADLGKILDGGLFRFTVADRPIIELPAARLLKASANVVNFGQLSLWRLQTQQMIPAGTRIKPILKLRTALAAASQVQFVMEGHLVRPRSG